MSGRESGVRRSGRGLIDRALAIHRRVDTLLPDADRFTRAAHDERVTSRIGIWLGTAFLLCFVTGLTSHLIQHPPAWFGWPSRPIWLYRVNQGTHVIAGVAAIPLLFAKLWSVFPKLFARPRIRSLPHLLERLSILALIGAAFFELATGLFNAAQNYPWRGRFSFLATHYAVGWVVIGSILVHVAVKLPVVRRGLARIRDDRSGGLLSRRGFLQTTWLAVGVAVVATAGVTVRPLRSVSILSWRSENGSQGLPVNKTASAAGVLASASDPEFRLQVVGPGRELALTLDELEDLPQTTARLPIACVEGWSQSATWSGVRVRDLVARVGPDGPVEVHSVQRVGAYRRSMLPLEHVRDPATLLALRLNGERLNLDHGYPCRLIAPNRPGVLQTKWVGRLVVLS